MPLSCKVDGRKMTARIIGEVDHHRARQLMLDLERKIEINYPKELILDLSGVTFMDSSGIAVLLRTCRRMRETDGTFQVTQVPRQAGRVLRAAGLQKMIPIEFSGEEE